MDSPEEFRAICHAWDLQDIRSGEFRRLLAIAQKEGLLPGLLNAGGSEGPLKIHEAPAIEDGALAFIRGFGECILRKVKPPKTRRVSNRPA